MSSLSRSRVNAFSSLVLERNSESRDDATFVQTRLAATDTRFLALRPDGKALLNASGDALFAFTQTQRRDLVGDAAIVYLGGNDIEWFLLRIDEAGADDLARQTHGQFRDLRSAALALPAFDAGLFGYARAIANWQDRMRFCNVCAAPVQLVSAGHRAKCTNLQCSTEHFPRTDPAIIVLVTREEYCLLGRGAGWPEKRYSTLAGFVEPGETLEDAVCREVFEESGVRVTDCDYYSSQPWPFPASIMLGFTATARDASIHIGHELEDARWFTAQQIVDELASGDLLLSPPLSISYRLLEQWMLGQGVDLGVLSQGMTNPWSIRR